MPDRLTPVQIETDANYVPIIRVPRRKPKKDAARVMVAVEALDKAFEPFNPDLQVEVLRCQRQTRLCGTSRTPSPKVRRVSWLRMGKNHKKAEAQDQKVSYPCGRYRRTTEAV